MGAPGDGTARNMVVAIEGDEWMFNLKKKISRSLFGEYSP